MCCHETKDHCCENQSHHHHDECRCKDPLSDPAFWTMEEKISWLEQQRDEMQQSIAALESRIVALRAELQLGDSETK